MSTNYYHKTPRNNSERSRIRKITPYSDGRNARFASAKFNDPPSPKCLPKPPKHWLLNIPPSSGNSKACESMNHVIAAQIKEMLKIQG